MSVFPLTAPTKRLAETIDGSALSFVVSNIQGWDGEDLESADLGTQHYVVFRNSTGTLMEIMEIDPATIASGSITIVRRGLAFNGDRTTQVAANKLIWIRGDTLIELGTDSPQLFQYFKDYIDGISIAGAPNATTTLQGLVELPTQAEVDAGTASGSLASLAVTPDKLRARKYSDYVADTGAANAYVITPSPAITAYAAGQVFTFKATNANTTTSTVNINGLGTKTIKKLGSVNLASGDIIAGQLVIIQYDGTNFQLLSHISYLTPTVQTFLVSGTYTKPVNLKYAVVECQGAGGGGATNGAGGGGGGYTKKIIAAASIGTTETVTVGTAAINSGNTSFGALLTAGNGAGASGATSGAGGAATGGDVNIPGQRANNPNGNGSAGPGGHSFMGFGATSTFNNDVTSVQNGTDGFGFGGGAAGGATASDGSPAGGTAGSATPGIVIVTEYYN